MFIKVKVKPRAGEQKVERIPDNLFSADGYEGLYFVKLKEGPEGGQANLELLKVLTRHFGKKVKIKAGFTSRNKIIEVEE